MTPAEILLGRARADWRPRDLWILRATGAALGTACWMVLSLLVVFLHPRYSNPLPFAVAAFIAAVFGILLFVLLTLKGPKAPPQPPA